uniref:Heat shock 70 kDa protein 12B-like n=1 Tax=Crassostrea virginica TaxID=6565 RepID=A0A8B8C0F6_CRAVI|nr:heat shock 70 kDa protein 12B-like [Crassostrea virginica]XP_022309128.1 heat shock 70 kDa protein 12B-like [Crassostrea virginica]
MACGDHVAVVAVDIGSAFSGYAYQYRTDYLKNPTENITCPLWIEKNNKATGKTASSLLLNPDGSFNSFGFNAEVVYSKMFRDHLNGDFKDDKFPNKSPLDWFLFKNFKMRLYEKEVLRRNMKINDETGKKGLPIKTIFRESIGFFKRHALEALCKEKDVRSDDVFWVLTVPAIWSEPAKQLMRVAAIEAGIPSESLTLALEPEAAALFTKEQKLCPQSRNGKVDLVPFTPGSMFMVIDLGGGTGDITIHEVQSDQSLHEKSMATGGDWGGNKINETFLEIWKDILGKEFTQCMKEYPDEILELQHEFEFQKRSIGENTGKRCLYIPIPECCREIPHFKKKFEESTKYPGLKVNRGKTEFPNEMIEGLFLDKIKKHVGGLLTQNSVDAIILVGGFSESKLIYKSMKDTFQNIKILNPPECGLSVLKGAVLYGFQPQQIAERVSRYSYGFSIRVPFDPEVHCSERDLVHKVDKEVEDVFRPIILAGENVVANEEREYRCRTAYLGLIQVEFYGTRDSNPKYVNDYEEFKPEFPCLHIGDIVGKYDSNGKPDNNEVLLRVVFGHTQLNVTAEFVVKGEKKLTNARFELLT